MPGVLVDEQTFPFDSPVFSPMIHFTAPCSFAQVEEDADDAVAGSLTSDLNAHDSSSPCSSRDSGSVNVPAFHALGYFITPPPTSEKRGGKVLNLDGHDGFLTRSFWSKLAEQGSVSVGDERGLDELSKGDGMGLESGEDGSIVCNDLNECVNTGIEQQTVYGNSNGGTTFVGSPFLPDTISGLQRYLPSNNEDDVWCLAEVYSSDEFRMYEFKVRKCMRGRSHDWTECPFAHPGEKARRRDPRRFHYSGTACPDFRKGSCKKGDACEHAHGVFECWLHPARYRTQPCKDGKNCRRRVCFFAHTPEQLRLISGSSQGTGSVSRVGLHSSALKPLLSGCYDGSPLRQALAGSFDSAPVINSISRLVYNGPLGTFDGHLVCPQGDQVSAGDEMAYGGAPVSSQIPSPTSTLVRHLNSPSILSPAQSPPDSPSVPDSSGSTSPGWAQSLCRGQGSLSQHCPRALQSIVPDALQPQASVMACSPYLVSATGPTGAPQCPSPRSQVVSGQYRHIHKLNSIPSVSNAAFERSGFRQATPPSSQRMTNLMASIQQLELRSSVAETNHFASSSWSPRVPSHNVTLSLPCTPRNGIWAGQFDAYIDECKAKPRVERVESGCDLREEIYTRLDKENPLENESPDLDWVDELVK